MNKLISKRTFARSFGAIFGPDTQPSAEELDLFWQLLVHKGGRAVFHRLIGYIPEREKHRERWVGALRASAVPLGLINGSVDPVSGAHMVRRYREVVSRQHYIVELARIGHYPHVEAPAESLAAYRRFLATI